MTTPERFSSLVLRRCKGMSHTSINAALVQFTANVHVMADIAARDLWTAMLTLYVPGTEHKVEREVWVAEVPATRWDMLKAALGLRHHTIHIYAPDVTVYKVCPQLPLTRDQLEWLANPVVDHDEE